MFQRSLQPEPYQNDRDMLAARVHHSQHLTRQMATVLGLTKVLNSRHKLEQQLTVILNETNRILDADFSVFYLLNERRKELWPHFL